MKSSMSKGMSDSSENNKYKYLSVSARKNESSLEKRERGKDGGKEEEREERRREREINIKLNGQLGSFFYRTSNMRGRGTQKPHPHTCNYAI